MKKIKLGSVDSSHKWRLVGGYTSVVFQGSDHLFLCIFTVVVSNMQSTGEWGSCVLVNGVFMLTVDCQQALAHIPTTSSHWRALSCIRVSSSIMLCTET